VKKYKFYTYTQISGEESERLLVKLRELIDSGTIIGDSDLIKRILLLLEYDEINNTITIDGGTYEGSE